MKKFLMRWIKKPDTPPLIVILLIAAFMRLYRISDYMTFLGDEGRDAIVAREILSGNLTLLGPRASAGDFFLGPIYYYMIAPFLLLAKYDPVGPAIMVALIGIATVGLIYLFCREFFSTKAAIIASLLYAISPLVVAYSRSSWNPNPMPFFTLLTFYTLYKGVELKKIKLFAIAGFLIGIMMQLHYLTVFIISIVAIFIFVSQLFDLKRKNISEILVRLFKYYGSLFGGFLIGFSPFLAFEFRHNFPNIRTILRFVFQDNLSAEYITNTSFVSIIYDVFFRLFARLLVKFPNPLEVSIAENPYLIFLQWTTLALAVISILFLLKTRNKILVLLLLLWLGLGVIQFGVYKRQIYDYYYGFLFPVPFILIGNFLGSLFESKKLKILSHFVGYVILFGLLYINLSGFPFQFPANRQKDQAKTIAEFVMEKAGGQPYNFALITNGNSDHVYRYFFESEGKTPVEIKNFEVDPNRESVTDQLLIVCESLPCSPLGHSLWEIAGFGRAEIAGEWQVSVVKVYRLIHYQDQ